MRTRTKRREREREREKYGMKYSDNGGDSKGKASG